MKLKYTRILYFLLLTTLFWAPAEGAYQAPRLFFTKKIKVSEKDLVKKHIVKPGEHLYQILRDYGIAEKELATAFHTTVSINPNLSDPNKLKPGQTLFIPLSSEIDKDKFGKVSVRYDHPRKGGSTSEVEYTVRPGDRVVDLFREAGLADRQIFSEYLQLFREMNPHIPDADRIEVGQRIIIPLPEEFGDVKTFSVSTEENATLGQQGGQENGTVVVSPLLTKESPGPSTPSPVQKRKIVQPPPKRNPVADKRSFVVSILKILGFRFTPGEELLYPTGEDSWFKVNLKQTPLCRAPWGDQFALLPRSRRDKQQEFEKIFYTPVLVEEDWDPKKVLTSIEEKSMGQIKIWKRNHPLILNKGGLTLELNASLLIRMQDRRFFLFNILNPDDKPAPALVHAFFSRKGIMINEWVRQLHAPPKPVSPAFPRHQDLYVPWVDRYNAWPQMKERLTGVQNLHPGGLDIDSVITALEEKNMLSREPLRLSWFPGQERELAVIIPATFVNSGQNTLALLSSNQASPHLVALLALKGYGCLAVR